MKELLFIGYNQADLIEVDWIDRLKMYLAPYRNAQIGHIWDAGGSGSDGKWIEEVADALHRAKVALLIIGPAFLASDFVTQSEAADLLANARDKGLKVFPLITGYCGYEATELGQYRAFNDQSKPLESLKRFEQNKVLNRLCIAVNKALRDSAEPKTSGKGAIRLSLREAVLVMKDLLDTSHKAFMDQCDLRDALVRDIENRLEILCDAGYERFFFQYFPYLTQSERVQFDHVRAITEVLHARNEEIVHTMDENPQLLDTFPVLSDLRQHLVFWLNKFDRVFTRNKAMCVVYTGPKDAVPFPLHAHDVINEWLTGK